MSDVLHRNVKQYASSAHHSWQKLGRSSGMSPPLAWWASARTAGQQLETQCPNRPPRTSSSFPERKKTIRLWWSGDRHRLQTRRHQRLWRPLVSALLQSVVVAAPTRTGAAARRRRFRIPNCPGSQVCPAAMIFCAGRERPMCFTLQARGCKVLSVDCASGG